MKTKSGRCSFHIRSCFVFSKSPMTILSAIFSANKRGREELGKKKNAFEFSGPFIIIKTIEGNT